jgi:hypothetical protein
VYPRPQHQEMHTTIVATHLQLNSHDQWNRQSPKVILGQLRISKTELYNILVDHIKTSAPSDLYYLSLIYVYLELKYI